MQSLLASVDLTAIAFNAEYFKNLSACPLIAVVKDDAYGHGAEEVALSLHGRAASFAVATVEEGVSLRVAGVTEDILVLTPPMTEEECGRLLGYGLIASVTSYPAFKLLSDAGEKFGIAPRVHLALNTGMNRYGVADTEAGKFARLAKKHGFLVEGVFSHYFSAENDGARERQDLLFARGASAVKEVFPDCIAHIAATEGTLKEKKGDAVRIGLGLYGYRPEGGSKPLRRAMKLYAYVSNCCKQYGEGIGYAPSDGEHGVLHTLRLGYGDGFFREGMDGVIGKLCMDAAIGEGRASFGERKLIVSDFEAYARSHGTTVYEALVRLPAKAEREYIN